MVNDKDIDKFKLTLLARDILKLGTLLSTNGLIVFLGCNVLPYRAEYPISDCFYDIICFLEELCIGMDCKRTFSILIKIIKKARKKYTPYKASAFISFWLYRHDQLDHNVIIEAAGTFTEIFSLLYRAAYTGNGQLADSSCSMLRADILSFQLFGQSCMGIITGHTPLEPKDFPHRSPTFDAWLKSFLIAGRENYVQIVRSLCNFYGNKNVLDVFGLDDTNSIDQLAAIVEKEHAKKTSSFSETALEQLHKRFNGLAEQVKLNRYNWNTVDVKNTLTILNHIIIHIYDHACVTAPLDESRMFFAPLRVHAGHWTAFRENRIWKTDEFTLQELKEIFESAQVKSILRKRRFTVSENGTVLRLIKHYFGITHIYVAEVHRNEMHYIWVTARCMPGENSFYTHLFIPINNLSNCIPFMLYNCDFYLLLFLLHWFDLIDDFMSAINTLVVGHKLLSQINEAIALLSSLEIMYSDSLSGLPRENRTHVDFDSTSYDTEIKQIDWFTRYLPPGAVASREAIKNAKEKFLDLPEGKTFVSSHERHICV